MLRNGRSSSNSGTFRGGRVFAIAIVLAALSMAAIGGILSAPANATTDVTYSQEELAFVSLLNDYRASKGLSRLLISDTLSLAADRHSSDMSKYSFFSHQTGWDDANNSPLPDLRSDWFATGAWPWDRMKACGYDYNTSMGENIAAGVPYAAARAVFDGFKNSPGHNGTMLGGQYNVVGVSQVLVPGTAEYVWWTVDFGGYVDSSAWAHAPATATTRLEQTGLPYPNASQAGLSYSRVKWNINKSKYASGRNFWSVNRRGAAVTVTFNGTNLRWIATKGRGYGKALVVLDGGPATYVDLYSRRTLYQQCVYDTGALESGAHTLTISWTGLRTRGASSKRINVDAFDIVTPQ